MDLGQVVHLWCPTAHWFESTADGFHVTGLPAAIQPSTPRRVNFMAYHDGDEVPAQGYISGGGMAMSRLAVFEGAVYYSSGWGIGPDKGFLNEITITYAK